MSGNRLQNRILAHKARFEKNEKLIIFRSRQYYRGEFHGFRNNEFLHNDKYWSSEYCTKNIIYAVTDSAISSLLGPNPQVSSTARNPKAEQVSGAINAYMEWVFSANDMRERSGLTLMDAVLAKRGIFKTTWDEDEDRPSIQVVDPARLFFDPSARVRSKIRYYIEATPVSWAKFKRRVEKGTYSGVNLHKVKPMHYPTWLLDDITQSEYKGIQDTERWVMVWEHHDVERGVVEHYSDQANVILRREKLDYQPYTMYSLNHSGVDCGGLSEVQLILNQQTTVNDLLTHLKRITYLMIPRILYNAGIIDQEEFTSALASSTGSLIPVNVSGAEAMSALARLFFEMPYPQHPEGVFRFLERVEDDAAYVSALAESARGKVTGARTATEMAVIDAQLRTRLATREGHLAGAIEDVASKCLYLASRYMQKEKMLRVTGAEDWVPLNLDTLDDVDLDFNMVSYNPIKQNPSVMMETMVQLLPALVQYAPNIDKFELFEALVSGLGLPQKLIIPQEQARKMLAAQEQAAQQAALGGAAVAQSEQGAAGQAEQAQGGIPPEALAGIEGAAESRSAPVPLEVIKGV